MTATTEMTGPARRRWRRRLLLLGLLPLFLTLAFATKVAVMLVHDDAGRTAYAAGRYADARGSFAANATLNHLEPWVSPYDEGTARYRLGDFAGAVAAFTTALVTVPPEEECRVRINLGLAHESVGDAAVAGGDREAARRSWRAGARALADGGCLTLTPAEEDHEAQDPEDARAAREAREADGADDADGARQAAEDDARRRARQAERLARVRDATTVDRRLRDKLSQQPPEAPTPESDDPEARQQARQDAARLEERNEQAQEERREQQQRRQDREAEEQRQQEEQERQPGTGDGEGEPLTYEW